MKLLNTELQAQQNCLKAVNKVASKLFFFWNRVEDLGYVKDVEMKIRPYNGGYQINTTMVRTEKYYGCFTGSEGGTSDIYKMIDGFCSLELYPEAWFEANLEREGLARIEGRKVSFTENYGSYRKQVKTNEYSEYEEFVEENRKVISEAMNMLK